MQDACEIVDVGYEVIVLGTGAGDADRVAFLEGIRADQVGWHLAAEDNHGNGVHHRIGDGRDHIGGAGAGCDKGNAAFAGGTGIAFGGMACALFMAHQDVADVRRREKRVIDGEYRTAGIAKERVYTLLTKRLDDDLGARHDTGLCRCRVSGARLGLCGSGHGGSRTVWENSG